MKTPEIMKTLKMAYALREPVYISGAPGIGKSQVVHQFTAADGLDMRDCRLVYWDPVDLRGIPQVIDRKTCWMPPSVFPTEGKGIMFFDELPQAAPSVQAACLQLFLDRKLGEYTLPPDWTIVAAGNNQSDRAGANRLLSPLVSRAICVAMEVDLNAWSDWAIAANLNPMILAFIRFRVDLLHSWDPAKWDGKSYACPRTWEKLARVVDASPDVSREVMSGIVGEGPSVEFCAFRDMYKSLPPLDSILLNPKTTPVPDALAACWAIATGLARKATPGNFSKIMTYLDRIPAREFTVVGVRDAIAINNKLAQCPEFATWSIKNTDLLS